MTYGWSDAKTQKTDNPAPFKTPINEMTPVTIDLVKKQLGRHSSVEEYLSSLFRGSGFNLQHCQKRKRKIY